jgi:putative membrane protein
MFGLLLAGLTAHGRFPGNARWLRSRLTMAPHGVGGTRDASSGDGSVMDIVAWWAMHALCRAIMARYLDLRVQGLHHLPRAGPLLIACRHYHHFDDGCILLAVAPRPLHLLVALDWVCGRARRRLLEWALGLVRWPVVLRTERLEREPGQSAYRAEEAGRYLRRATCDAIGLLREGRILVVFPEAYPNVDSSFTLKANGDDFLPFRPGFIKLTHLAEQDGRTRVPIVPAGLFYRRSRRWHVTLRFGPPLFPEAWPDRCGLLRTVEEQVRLLSDPLQSNTSP